MSQFNLHPQLEIDSIFIQDLPLSQLRLNNQKNAPWLILVPRKANIPEIYQLDVADRVQLMEEITQASQALTELYAPDKINIGALGNMVPQLHVHVIARFKADEAWPHPIWGKITSEPYPLKALSELKSKLLNSQFFK